MATSLLNDQFDRFIDTLVSSVVEREITSFHQMMLNLPSVDPSLVFCSLQRLVATGRLAPQLLDTLRREAQCPYMPPATPAQTKLPIPHPLDYEWRFANEGISTILQYCLERSDPHDTIAMLGVPSAFEAALGEQSYGRRLLLIDSNVSATQCLTQVALPHEVMHCDLVHGQLPVAAANVAVIDAPWYPGIMVAFLRAASQICSLGGYVLMSVPPPSTRPTIDTEWQSMLRSATQMGLHLVSYDPLALPYLSPPFERNALRAAGITNYPEAWRRGDLAVFIHRELKKVRLPKPPENNDRWVEHSWSGVRIRLRGTHNDARIDPSLVSIVPGDILPSVSKRDSRRQLADVWTSGNRIFRCANTRILDSILTAHSTHLDPLEHITATLECPLSDREVALVRLTQDQVQQLIYVERNETLWYDG